MNKLDTSQTTWNFSTLYKSDDDPQIEKDRKTIEEKSYEFINKWKDNEEYLKDPKVLKEALDEYEKWAEDYSGGGKEGYYFGYKYYTDMNNPKIKAKNTKIEDFAKKISNDINFFTLRLAKISPDKQSEFLKNENLKVYKHFLERVFSEAKYVLTEAEEKIMSLKSTSAYSNWVNMVDEFLSKEEREILSEDGTTKSVKSFEEIMGLLNSKKKEVRDSAAIAVNEIFEKNSGIAEAEINSILNDKKVNDMIRGFERPDQARHLDDDVDTAVVDSLVAAVSERFDIANRYYDLKAKMMGLTKLEYHERNVEYGNVDKDYTYEDAVSTVYKIFNDLDPKFGEIFKNFVEGGHIDVYPKKGKTGGAFCSYGSKTNPVLILLNFTNKLRDVMTLAHESGHGVNHELMLENQNSLNGSSSKFTAEVCSTFMEDFVLEDILKSADEELRLAVMMQKMNDFVSTIFRQIGCYNFETDLHKEYREKGFLPKEEIGKLFLKNMKAYMGDAVEQNEGSQNWWVYWGHIRSYFYVYSYASGLLISKSMQNSVKADHGFIEKIKEFLSAGSSDSPKNIFLKLGIDVTNKEFWNKGLDEIENLLKDTEALAKKLGKI